MKPTRYHVIGLIIVILLLSLLNFWIKLVELDYGHANIYSGWILFSLLVLLLIYNTRKKFSFLPLGKVFYWRFVHIYLGTAALGLFILHAGIKPPAAGLQIFLFWLFLLVTAIGLLGIYLAKILPARLTHLKQIYLYEQLPVQRYKLQLAVEAQVLDSIEQTQSHTISRFYQQQINDYMQSFRDSIYHTFDSKYPYKRIDNWFNSLTPYIDEKEHRILQKIRHMVEQKRSLDYQYYNQALLKYWPFLHIAFAYSLIVFVLLHALVIHAFIGGVL